MELYPGSESACRKPLWQHFCLMSHPQAAPKLGHLIDPSDVCGAVPCMEQSPAFFRRPPLLPSGDLRSPSLQLSNGRRLSSPLRISRGPFQESDDFRTRCKWGLCLCAQNQQSEFRCYQISMIAMKLNDQRPSLTVAHLFFLYFVTLTVGYAHCLYQFIITIISSWYIFPLIMGQWPFLPVLMLFNVNCILLYQRGYVSFF